MGTTRAGNAQGTPTQSQISSSILVYEGEENRSMAKPLTSKMGKKSKVFKTFASKWRKPEPASGLDFLMFAEFARQPRRLIPWSILRKRRPLPIRSAAASCEEQKKETHRLRLLGPASSQGYR